jgi:hypothetical protein
VILECVFDSRFCPLCGLGLIEVVQQVINEYAEAGFVEAMRKGVTNKGAGLGAVHLASSK